jgi:predicted amidohydrolase
MSAQTEGTLGRQFNSECPDGFRVALIQMYCGWADTSGNLERMAMWAERAAKGRAELVVFPELCVSGICKDDRLDSVTESLDGPSVGFVRNLARRLGLAIGFGFSERALGKPYNAYAVVEPDGRLAGVYRKNYIPELEVPFWQGHSERPVFRVLGHFMGVAICWDNKYPELLNHYARSGAEIVLMPHAWDSDALDEEGRAIDYHSMEEIAQYVHDTGRMNWKTHDQMRNDFYIYIPDLARDGRFWAVFVNQAGRPHNCLQFVGPSFVVNPTGEVVAETRDGKDQLLFVDLDLTGKKEGMA